MKNFIFSSIEYFDKNRILFLIYCIQFIVLQLLNGCSYVIEGSNPTLPDEAKTIAILPIQNQTFIAGLETDLSEQIYRLLRSNSSVEIVPAGIADLQVSITLLDYKTDTSGLNKEQVSAGIKAMIGGEAILLDKRTNKKVWQDSMINVQLTESLENEMETKSSISLSRSTREIIKIFASNIYSRIFSNF